MEYPSAGGTPDGSQAPTVIQCQDSRDWQDLVHDPNGGDFYKASVQFRRNQADDGDIFRLYVVRGGVHWAHRDVVVDPNLTTPADGFVKAIGYGTEPIKIRIGQDVSCVKFDTQASGTQNAATCLISGDTETTFSFNEEQFNTELTFPGGNGTFFADIEVSECLSLGFAANEESGVGEGNALVDVPLADCMISVGSDEIDRLTNAAEIDIEVKDPRWLGAGAFANGRLNVLQTDVFGTGVLPRSDNPTWFGEATSNNVVLRWLDRGLGKLASLLGPQPLSAYPSAGWDFTRMSDFQIALMPVMEHDASMSGDVCGGVPSCLDLGTFGGATPTAEVIVHVTGPTALADPNYPGRADPTGTPFDVPDTRLHFFPETGEVGCPATPVAGQVCVPAGEDDLSTTPASIWPDHLVVVTGTTGRAVVDWSLAGGENSLDVVGCGVARPGDNEPDPLNEPGSDGVWGDLAGCENRSTARTRPDAYDNGPADGFTPFEPVRDSDSEVGIYGLPLTFEARTCPLINIDGIKGDSGTEWEACADKTAFSAPLKGPKGQENAWLYTYDDGESLYIGLEVLTTNLGNRIFVQLAEQYGTDGVEAAGDDILVIDFGNGAAPEDWHLTANCLGNNANNLCGARDLGLDDGSNLAFDAFATLDGAGAGRAFYEFKRPLNSLNSTGPNKEDLAAIAGQQLGLKLTMTQGQGGGKGGFTFPDPQGPIRFFPFALR